MQVPTCEVLKMTYLTYRTVSKSSKDHIGGSLHRARVCLMRTSNCGDIVGLTIG